MRTVLHDRYEVVEELGKGGTSRVYLCIDNHIHKRWAVKQLERNGLDLSLIGNEINKLKALDFYLFPRITDAFSEGKYAYIVTDYIEGKTLESIVKEKEGLPESIVINYLKELIKGLIFLHSESPPILYLDMKPSNIMVRPDGELRLIDFGIAQSVIEESLSMGTPGYSPPEQFIKGYRLTEKADVFSLGMTAYTLLTGQKPYKDYNTQISIIKKSCISKRMKELILMTVEYDEHKRPSVQELSSLLTRFVGRDRKMKVLILGAAAISIVFCLSTGIVADINREQTKKNAAIKMVQQTEKYIQDGEYTPEGIKIIRGYLDGNFLDEKTEEYFTYEVARNLFEIQRDYSSAKRYFTRLNEEEYPEIQYFIQICDIMTGFAKDAELKECIENFKAYNSTVFDEEKKARNEELIQFINLSGGY